MISVVGYSDVNCETPIVANTPITESITVYAKWTIGTYTVSLNVQGGTNIDEISKNGNETIDSSLLSTTKDGFTFSGWYKNANCTEVWDFENDKVTEDTTLFAKWVETTYSIVLILKVEQR
ncbi:MAG: InlB B-repeat-containing protein [Clostridia bacterium]